MRLLNYIRQMISSRRYCHEFTSAKCNNNNSTIAAHNKVSVASGTIKWVCRYTGNSATKVLRHVFFLI